MNDFFDTGVIIGTSYVQNIKYEGFEATDIDSNSILCFKRYNKCKKITICNSVVAELRRIQNRREIMHRILVLELKNSTDKYKEYSNLEYHSDFYSEKAKERDERWIDNMAEKLKKYDIKDVFYTIENIRLMFELNIENIIKNVCIFRPSDEQKTFRTDIINCVRPLLTEINHMDQIIFFNAIIYHNENEKICFVSVDKGFDRIHHSNLQNELKTSIHTINYPSVEIISN